MKSKVVPITRYTVQYVGKYQYKRSTKHTNYKCEINTKLTVHLNCNLKKNEIEWKHLVLSWVKRLHEVLFHVEKVCTIFIGRLLCNFTNGLASERCSVL